MWKLENIHPYEVSVSRKRPRKEVRLQVSLEGGYSSRVSDKRWKRVRPRQIGGDAAYVLSEVEFVQFFDGFAVEFTWKVSVVLG